MNALPRNYANQIIDGIKGHLISCTMIGCRVTQAMVRQGQIGLRRQIENDWFGRENVLQRCKQSQNSFFVLRSVLDSAQVHSHLPQQHLLNGMVEWVQLKKASPHLASISKQMERESGQRGCWRNGSIAAASTCTRLQRNLNVY